MAKRHEVGAELLACAIQKRMTRGVRCAFDGAVLLAGDRSDVGAIEDERAAQRFSQFDAKSLVPVSCYPELMVEMSEANKAALATAIELVQKVSECNRVRSARHGCHHGLFRSQQLMAPDRLPNPILESHVGWRGPPPRRRRYGEVALKLA